MIWVFAEVRLNGEVDAVMEVDFTREISPGETVTIQDIGAVRRIQLTEKDPNAGHITIVQRGGGYAIAFDFTRNVARSSQYFNVASEFMEAAEISLDNNLLRSFVDNLHSGVELVAKGILIQHERSVLTTKKHGHVSAKLNLWTRYGNIDAQHSRLLNGLQSLRNSARYLEGDFTLSAEKAREMLLVAKQMLSDLGDRLRNSERAVLPETKFNFSGNGESSTG